MFSRLLLLLLLLLLQNLYQTKKYKSALRVVNNWLNDKSVISTISERLDYNASGSDVENTDAAGDGGDNDEAQEKIESGIGEIEETVTSEDEYDVEKLSDYAIRVIAQVHCT